MTFDLFRDRIAVLATMHRKEQAIAPVLEPALGIKVWLPPQFDSDRFGTFTREVNRPADQCATARLKAEAALAQTGETLAIASEGSFGAHPALPYLPCNREIVLLLDRENDLEVVGEELAIETNYSRKAVTSLKAAQDFAQQVGFPTHGLVVMPPDGETVKGIIDAETLAATVTAGLQHSDQVWLETDMRALYNPTRMRAIERATQHLLQKLSQRCPQCAFPGWDIVERQRGLPCELCHLPTSLVRAAVYQCQKCRLTQTVLFPDRLEYADPAQCAYCNP